MGGAVGKACESPGRRSVGFARVCDDLGDGVDALGARSWGERGTQKRSSPDRPAMTGCASLSASQREEVEH